MSFWNQVSRDRFSPTFYLSFIFFLTKCIILDDTFPIFLSDFYLFFFSFNLGGLGATILFWATIRSRESWSSQKLFLWIMLCLEDLLVILVNRTIPIELPGKLYSMFVFCLFMSMTSLNRRITLLVLIK